MSPPLLEIYVKSEDKAFGNGCGVRVTHCLRVEIVMVVAGYNPKITSFQRYGSTLDAYGFQPFFRELVSQADTLEAEIVLLLDPDVQFTEQVLFFVT